MKREEQRIFAGSLNLLTPSDKTPEGDAIDLRNWRVDQAGVLRGADGFTRLTQVGGGAIHTIFKLDDFSTTQAYVNGVESITWGVGDNGETGAFLIGAGTSLYFYLPIRGAGGVASATLATGLSGNKLSIVVWNGFIWVLDSLKQIKIDPWALSASGNSSAVTPWLPAIPESAINATANTTGNGLLTGSFNYYCTYVDYGTPTINGFLTAKESALSPAATVTAAGGAVSVSPRGRPS